MLKKLRWTFVSWANNSVGTKSCPTPLGRPAGRSDPTRPWYVRVLGSTSFKMVSCYFHGPLKIISNSFRSYLKSFVPSRPRYVRFLDSTGIISQIIFFTRTIFQVSVEPRSQQYNEQVGSARKAVRRGWVRQNISSTRRATKALKIRRLNASQKQESKSSATR